MNNKYSIEMTDEAFDGNTEIASVAEKIVAALVPQVYDDLDNVRWVGSKAKYYHTGDVIATDCWNDLVSFEVKDDGACHRTGNFFFEHMKYSRAGNLTDGYMKVEFADYLVVHSEAAQHCWFLDMPALQKDGFYETGRYIPNCHNQTRSAGFLHSIAVMRRDGFLLAECDYDFDVCGKPIAKNVIFYK